MSPHTSAEIPTEIAPTRVGGSIPSRATSSQEEDSPGKPGKSEPPGWFASTMASAMAEDALAAHDEAWRQQFIRPLAAFMMQRDVAHLRLDLVEDKAQFALIAKGETVKVFELVDATSEEQYFPLGVFFDYAAALKAAEAHHPGRWEPIMEQIAWAEIRARKVGTSGGDYTVLWRGEWFYDYEAGEWKLVEQQTGTLEKPLPLTRP